MFFGSVCDSCLVIILALLILQDVSPVFPATRTPPPQPLSEPELESVAAMSQTETEPVAAPVQLVMHCAKISPCIIYMYNYF